MTGPKEQKNQQLKGKRALRAILDRQGLKFSKRPVADIPPDVKGKQASRLQTRLKRSEGFFGYKQRTRSHQRQTKQI